MIDPVRPGTDPALRALPRTGVGPTNPGRINGLASVRLDELNAVLAAAPRLTPAQSKQIVALLRATVESFAVAAPEGRAGGSLSALQAAVVSLGQLQENLATALTRQHEQTRTVAPILRALHLSTSGGDLAEELPLAMRSAVPTPTPPTSASSVMSLAQSLAEAMARLDETLGAVFLPPAVPAHRAGPASDEKQPGLAQPLQSDPQPANAGSPPARVDHPDAVRWLLDSALTLTPSPPRPAATPGEVVRLTSLAHALLDALSTPTPANSLTENADRVRGSAQALPQSAAATRLARADGPLQVPVPTTGDFAPVADLLQDPVPTTGDLDPVPGLLQDPEDAAPLQGDLWVALDRYPGVRSVLGPILGELGLAAQRPASSMSAEVAASAVGRAQILAVIVLAEAGEIGERVEYRQILAACEAAGMPPFSLPLDSADNIESYRWLLIAAQLYNSRVASRAPLQRCTRCGRALQLSRTGLLTCSHCG